MKHAIFFVGALAVGCGEADTLASTNPFQPHDDDKVTVIGGDVTVPVANGDLSAEGCLQVTAESCIAVDRTGTYCKTDAGPADAVLVGGMVAQVVCYSDDPQKGTTTVVSGGDLDVAQHDNGAVLVFDPKTNGTPIHGDVKLDANNVTLYGNGPDSSIIDGNLIITGNNARVRGIRVKGNVEIKLNTAALLLSVVEGNLTVDANNALVAETAVFGNFKVGGNNAILVGDGAAKEWDIHGSGARCERNHRIDDQGVPGAALSCP